MSYGGLVPGSRGSSPRGGTHRLIHWPGACWWGRLGNPSPASLSTCIGSESAAPGGVIMMPVRVRSTSNTHKHCLSGAANAEQANATSAHMVERMDLPGSAVVGHCNRSSDYGYRFL